MIRKFEDNEESMSLYIQAIESKNMQRLHEINELEAEAVELRENVAYY